MVPDDPGEAARMVTVKVAAVLRHLRPFGE